MQPSLPSPKQRVTLSLPTALIERLRNEALGQVCPDVPPQPGVQEFARPPPGMRRTDTIRSAPRGLAAHRAGSPPQYHGHHPSRIAVRQSQAQGLTFFDIHVRISCLWHGNTFADQGLTCCTWSENPRIFRFSATLLYRKHSSCSLSHSLIAGEARYNAGDSSAPCHCYPPDGVVPALHPPPLLFRILLQYTLL